MESPGIPGRFIGDRGGATVGVVAKGRHLGERVGHGIDLAAAAHASIGVGVVGDRGDIGGIGARAVDREHLAAGIDRVVPLAHLGPGGEVFLDEVPRRVVGESRDEIHPRDSRGLGDGRREPVGRMPRGRDGAGGRGAGGFGARGLEVDS